MRPRPLKVIVIIRDYGVGDFGMDQQIRVRNTVAQTANLPPELVAIESVNAADGGGTAVTLSGTLNPKP